jgi:hypothetical protein
MLIDQWMGERVTCGRSEKNEFEVIIQLEFLE